MSDWVNVGGTVVPLAQCEEGNPQRGGQVTRAYAGNARITLGRWVKRNWNGVTPLMPKASAQAIRTTIAANPVQSCTGDMFDGLTALSVVVLFEGWSPDGSVDADGLQVAMKLSFMEV